MPWDAATVRARGLATHLLRRESLTRAAAAGSWAQAARVLVEHGYPLSDAAHLSAEDLERETAGLLSRRLALLSRWLGPASDVLAVITEDDDRRNLRALLRGAAQGASPGARLQGLVPTASLPHSTLERLAHADSPAQLAELLVRAGHAAGRPLREAARAEREARGGTLWRMEFALSQVFALRLTRAARRGGRAVRRLAACLLDLENACSLLLAPEWGAGVLPDDVFLPGGSIIGREEFARIAALGNLDQVLEALAMRFTGTPLRDLFLPGLDTVHFERRAQAALLEWQYLEARRDPLGPWVLLLTLQRMRIEARDVRFLAGALRMGAPPGTIAAGLVTPS